MTVPEEQAAAPASPLAESSQQPAGVERAQTDDPASSSEQQQEQLSDKQLARRGKRQQKQQKQQQKAKDSFAEGTSASLSKSEGKQGEGKMSKSARGRPSDDPDVRVSKTLSYILRHGAQKEGLKLRDDGFVRLSDLLARPKLKGVDVPTVERLVAADAKQRYTLRLESLEAAPEGAPPSELWIRANQGHSLQVDKLELVPITSLEDAPAIVVHGTFKRHWASIEREGLRRMTRTHIHCATGLPSAEKGAVISGMRSQCDVLVYLDVGKMLQDQIPLLKSANGVVLTPGQGDEGILPPAYFARVTDKAGQVLYPADGSS